MIYWYLGLLQDIDDSDIRPGKVRKLHEPQLTLNLEGFNLGVYLLYNEITGYSLVDSIYT